MSATREDNYEATRIPVDWKDLVNRSVGCQTKESEFARSRGKHGLQKTAKRFTAKDVSQQLLQGVLNNKLSDTKLEKFKSVFANPFTFSSTQIRNTSFGNATLTEKKQD